MKVGREGGEEGGKERGDKRGLRALVIFVESLQHVRPHVVCDHHHHHHHHHYHQNPHHHQHPRPPPRRTSPTAHGCARLKTVVTAFQVCGSSFCKVRFRCSAKMGSTQAALSLHGKDSSEERRTSRAASTRLAMPPASCQTIANRAHRGTRRTYQITHQIKETTQVVFTGHCSYHTDHFDRALYI